MHLPPDVRRAGASSSRYSASNSSSRTDRVPAATSLSNPWSPARRPTVLEALCWSELGYQRDSYYKKLNFDFVRDVAPIAGFIRVPNVLVVNLSVPAKTVPEFIAYAKANPGKINMASSGNGTVGHVSGELFKMMTGVNMQNVPYRGESPTFTDLMAGQVQVTFNPMPGVIELVRAGKVRALAVTTTTRSENLPDLPVLADFVPGYESSTWYGVGAPKNTPVEIIDRLNKEINAIFVVSQDQGAPGGCSAAC